MNSYLVHRALKSVLTGQPEWHHLTVLVSVCRRIAVACVRENEKPILVTSESDLAIQLMSQLFERDHGGRFVRIRSYFDAHHWETQDEEMMLTLLRRLVFTTVANGLALRAGL